VLCLLVAPSLWLSGTQIHWAGAGGFLLDAAFILTETQDSTTMSEIASLLSPSSIGACLAEESTIDSAAPLPSFLEMKLLSEAFESSNIAISYTIGRIRSRLRRYSERLVSRSPAINDKRLQLLVFLQSFSEIFAPELGFLISFALERYFLARYCASSAETLYGMKRCRALGDSGLSWKLSDLQQRCKNLITFGLAIIPYVRARLNAGVPDIDPGYLQLLDSLTRVCQGLNLFCQWRYLIGKSIHFDLISTILGQTVRRRTQRESEQVGEASTKTKGNVMAFNSFYQRAALLASVSLIFSWVTEVRAQWLSSKSNAGVPAPHLQKIKMKAGICPLCRRGIKNPVASSSGVVYCSSCIHSCLKASSPCRCPVTGSPTSLGALVPLYSTRRQD